MTDHRLALQDGLADRYRFERELGRGGMAVVYLAHDVRHDRPVALKVLKPELAQALGAERFQREIHVAARLQHPHILTVLDSGETAGQFWFTMPYVEGESLRARLDRETQLSIDDAIRVARDAAQALQYAHDHGVVHRDIKPENLLLTSDGNTLVADFGIARALGAPEGDRLTQTGTSIGTAAYMSPEQAAGEREVGARSDIYSLGVVLYEMLAGETPFAAPTPQAEIARRFVEAARPLRSVRDTVPESVERAVAAALSRTAADRPPSARIFSEMLAPQATATASAAVTPAAAPAQRRRLRAPGLLTLLTGLLLGAGLLFAWSRSGSGGGDRERGDLHAASAETRAVRIAVLPFQNLGDTADGYFADGVTDAVRGKLAALDGLAVIASASSEEYRGSTKNPAQIADELGVDYLLTGRVRWVRQPDGTSRVQVSPELVEIGDGTARTRWGEPFDAPLTDVFAVQGQIATRVSGALNVALAGADRATLAERPTRNLEAYDAYLKGEASRGAGIDGIRRALAHYEQAVEHDPAFGIAWARLAAVRTQVWTSAGTQKPSRRGMEHALERAMSLAPDAPETWHARIGYASMVQEGTDTVPALAARALEASPGDADLLRLVGSVRGYTGNLEEGLGALRRAVQLDPRSPRNHRALGNMLMLNDREVESRAAFGRALLFDPGDAGNIQNLAWAWLMSGNLAEARRVVNEAQPVGGRAALFAQIAMYQDLYWLLDPAQQDTVLRLPVASFDNDPGARALAFAQIHHQRGDSAAMRAWADSARLAFMKHGPDFQDAQIPGLIGLALAYQGRHAEALRFGRQAVAQAPPEGTVRGPYYERHLLARIYLLQGNHEAALDLIEALLAAQYYLSPAMLRIDPAFAPLRGNARYERMAR